MSELRRIMMMFPRPDGSTPSVTIDGYVAFLSDFSDMVSGSRIATDGSVETLSGWSISGYIEIPDDARYVYYDEDIDDQYTGLYDSSKTYIGHITKGNAVSLSAKYLRVSMSTDNISDGIIVILKEQREEPIPVLPYDAEVEYLRNTGLTQFIDTGIVGGEGLRIVTEITPQQSARDKWAIGSWNTNARIYVVYQYPDGKWGGGYGNYFSGTANMSIGTKVELDVEYTSSQQIIKVNGTTVSTFAKSSNLGAITNTIYMFGLNDNKAATSAFLVDIGRTQIYMNGSLVRNFIPVRKDGVGYMYDTVSGELFGNSGTGTFTYGNDVTT